MTVAGPVAGDALGRVLVHEHVRLSYPGDMLDPSYRWDRASCVAIAIERMAALLEYGVRTFVDPCPIELGRDPELLAQVAQRSGMQIVCATGFYFEEIGIPYYWRSRTAEEVAELYLHEIEHGIGATGIRPGVIKIASSDPPGAHDRKVIEGAAIAARESGLPIISHCENSRGGDVQQDILEANGVDLSRCLIGHQDQEVELDNLEAIARRGSFVGIDRIGYEILAPDERRAEHVAALIDHGFTDHVCLSQDHMCCLCSPKFPYPIPPELREAFTVMEPAIREQMVDRPHTFLFTDFLPRLRDLGVGEHVVDRLLVENPRRLLVGS